MGVLAILSGIGMLVATLCFLMALAMAASHPAPSQTDLAAWITVFAVVTAICALLTIGSGVAWFMEA